MDTHLLGVQMYPKRFSSRDALAILPADESTISKKGKDNRYFSSAGSEKISNAFMSPVKKKMFHNKRDKTLSIAKRRQMIMNVSLG